MKFNPHLRQANQHAFLGASNYHWVNYSPEKLRDVYSRHLATLKGTMLHAFAAEAIKLGIKLQRSNKTLNLYVNDAIGFHMTPEVTLYFSDNCFGTADTISFQSGKLRIHDLKTGVTPAHFEQLMVYAALFCLEYEYEPDAIDIELRIYQSSEVKTLVPEPQDIFDIMEKIKSFDKIIDDMKAEEGD